MKIRTIEVFARPQDLAALRGVMSRLVTRFPENGEILDFIKAEYRAGRVGIISVRVPMRGCSKRRSTIA